MFSTIASQRFAGLENFIQLFTRDTVFSIAVLDTLEATIASVVLTLLLGLALALLLIEKTPLRALFRGAALIPG